MDNNKYGIDYIYEKYGKVAIEKEILADQAGYWKTCYEATKKEADGEIAKLDEELKEAKTAKDTWYKFWLESATKCDELKAVIEKLEAELEEKKRIIAGYGEEVGKLMLADEQKEALAEGDDW